LQKRKNAIFPFSKQKRGRTDRYFRLFLRKRKNRIFPFLQTCSAKSRFVLLDVAFSGRNKMKFIAGFVGLAGLLFWLIAFIGLLFPSFFKDKKTGEVPKRLHLFLGGTVAGIVAFVIAGVLMPASETPAVVDKPATAESAPVKEKTIEVSQVKNVLPAEPAPITAVAPSPREEKKFSFTPEEFRKRYNNFALQVDKKFVIRKIDVQKGDVNDTFMLTLGKGIGMVGSVNKKDGLLQSVILTLAGENDGVTPMMVFLATAHALTDGVPKEEISAAVSGMIKEAAEGVEKGVFLEREIGSVQYTMSANRGIGLMFVISPRDEEAVAGKNDAPSAGRIASENRPVGAAFEGKAEVVADRVIKKSFPECRRVMKAT
jgi:hypothetical protein